MQIYIGLAEFRIHWRQELPTQLEKQPVLSGFFFNYDLTWIAPNPATAAPLDFHNYTFKPYAEYFEQIKSQEGHLIRPQLAKNTPQTEQVHLLLRGENCLNST